MDWVHTTSWPNITTQQPPYPTSTPQPSDTPPPPANHTTADPLLPAGPSLAEILHGMATFRTALELVTWLFPVVVLVGVVGNTVSLWVLLRRGMRRTSASRYLACLAVADTVILLVSALKTWVRVVWGFELLHVSAITCKLFIFLTHLSLMAAAWLTVAVTLERFLAVWMPLRATAVCSVGRTRVVVMAILLLLALINAHVFWTAELLPVSPHRSLSSSGWQCSSYAHRTLACRVFSWVHLVLYCFLPALLLLGLNSLILFKLFEHHRGSGAIPANQDSRGSRSSSNRTSTFATTHTQLLARRKSHPRLWLKHQAVVIAGGGPQPGSRASHHQFHRRLTPMLLGVSFCWLVLTTPQTLYTLATPAPTGMPQAAAQFLVKTVCFLLMYVNHAVHFLLYCVTGQRFRQELRRGLVCTDSHSGGRLKKAFLLLPPKGPLHHSPPPTPPGGEEGEAALALTPLTPPLPGQNGVLGHKEHSLSRI